MTWNLSDAASAFPRHSAAWQELNEWTGNHVLLDPAFVQGLLDHFSDLPVVLATNTESSCPAMMLLVNSGCGSWQTYQPSQQPIGLALFADASQAERQLADLVRRLPGYALVLGVLQQDPAHSKLPLRAQVPHIELMDHLQTGRVNVAGDFSAFWADRPLELRQGMARRRRRLDQHGIDVTLRILRRPDEIEDGVRTFARLEQSGWKFGAGTAVGIEDAQGRFYAGLLQRLCRHGEGVVYELQFNQRTVASQLCVERGGMSVSLKIAFDGSCRSHAPGYLLQEEIIRHLHRRPGMDTIEFYGRATDGWTRKWTDDLRTIHHLNVFRNGVARRGIRFIQSLSRRHDQASAEAVS